TATWPGPIEFAQKHPVSLEVLRQQLGRLGDTPFALSTIQSNLPPSAMLPKSVLNELRRRAVAELLASRERRCNRTVNPSALEELRRTIPLNRPESEPLEPSLYVLARTIDQLNAVLSWRPQSPLALPAMIYCDFEDVRRYRDAVKKARDAGMPIGLAT